MSEYPELLKFKKQTKKYLNWQEGRAIYNVIEEFDQRLTALEGKHNHEQKEMFAIIKDFMDEHPECFASFAKPDALRTACEALKKWYDKDYNDYDELDEIIKAMKSALAAKDVGEPIEPLEFRTGDRRLGFDRNKVFKFKNNEVSISISKGDPIDQMINFTLSPDEIPTLIAWLSAQGGE